MTPRRKLQPVDPLLKISVAARLLGPWKPKTIRRWIRVGRIRAVKADNGQWLIPASEVQRYLARIGVENNY